MKNDKIVVKSVEISEANVLYKGEFEVSEDIGGLLKFVALSNGERLHSHREGIQKGYTFYSSGKNIAEMIRIQI